jgi:sulfide dehydrogenase [flavocytochrome c] flavoprotein chain
MTHQIQGLQRRHFLGAGAAGAALSLGGLSGCATPLFGQKPIGRVVVIGAGFGGATAAKYIRQWEPRIEVTLVERNERFVSCPISNLVLSGARRIEDVTLAYDGLDRHGVRRVRDEATAIDVERREVRLKGGGVLPWDRLIVAPGVDFQFDKVPGLAAADASGAVLHAWKAGPQTVALRRQLEALPDGGVFAIAIPKAPYRCPPGPYERASVVAQYFQQHKPRSKVLVLDANPDIVSKKGLFEKAWKELYPGLIEYRPNSELLEFDAAGKLAKLTTEDVRADLFNIIPPQQAGRVAQPFISVNNQWVGVEFQTFESAKAPGVHVIGDAIAAAPGMPKSGFMANNHAKVVADAVIARITGAPINETPIIANTCYSFVSDQSVVHVASVHKWDPAQKTLVAVQGAGGLSSARNAQEAIYADGWARSIWADALG